MSISSATSASAAAVSAQQSAARSGQSSQVQRPHHPHKAEGPPVTAPAQTAQPTTTARSGSKVNTMA